MASVRKYKNSKFYYACFTLANGKRVQRSTGEVLKREALKTATKWDSLARKKIKAKQAQKVIQEIHDSANETKLVLKSVKIYITDWLARRKSELTEGTHSAYESRLKDFQTWLGTRQNDYIGVITKQTLLDYREHLCTQVAGSTVNVAIKILRALFKNVTEDYNLEVNPASKVPFVKKTEVETEDEEFQEKRPFTEDEIRQVLSIIPQYAKSPEHASDWTSMVLNGTYSGQRMNDLRTLKWNRFKEKGDNMYISVKSQKTGKLIDLPLVPWMKDFIKEKMKNKTSEYVHPTLMEYGRTTISNQFIGFLAKLGLREKVTHRKRKEDGDRTKPKHELSFHSFRHTTNSILINAGVSRELAMEIVGHDSVDVSKGYTHINEIAKTAALNLLPILHQKAA